MDSGFRGETRTVDRDGSRSYLKIHALKKHYGTGDARVDVLRGIDVELSPGEICVLLGPSGSGKSTFLNLVGGLEPADEGSIFVHGTEVTALSDEGLVDYRREELGFVFQFYNLVPGLTLRENIEVCEYLSSEPLSIDDLLHSLGIWEQRDKFPREVSGGQQQRCAIGRALVKNPGLLLCDEPTGALDYQTGKQVLGLLQDTCRDLGRTVVLVTHNQAFCALADRVVSVREGGVERVERNPEPLDASLVEW